MIPCFALRNALRAADERCESVIRFSMADAPRQFGANATVAARYGIVLIGTVVGVPNIESPLVEVTMQDAHTFLRAVGESY